MSDFVLGFAIGWGAATLMAVFLLAKWDVRWPDGSRYKPLRKRNKTPNADAPIHDAFSAEAALGYNAWFEEWTDEPEDHVVITPRETYRWADADGFLCSPSCDSVQAAVDFWKQQGLQGRPIHRLCAFTDKKGRMLTDDERAEFKRLTGRELRPMPLPRLRGEEE